MKTTRTKRNRGTVELVNVSSGLMRCRRCGDAHYTNVRPGSRGGGGTWQGPVGGRPADTAGIGAQQER